MLAVLTDSPYRPSVSPRVPANRRPAGALLALTLALVAALVAVLFALQAALGGGSGGPLTAGATSTGAVSAGAVSAGAVQSASSRAWVVRPGDTLWSIAVAIRPHGDVRPLVDRLSSEVGGHPLLVGQRVALP